MSLSGSLNSSTFGPSGHYQLQMSWTATQSISANTSTVTVQMKMWSDSGWSMYTSATHSGNISIDPSGSSPLVNHGISDSSISTGGGSWVNIGSSISQTITHNDDGTMSFWLDGDFDFSGISISGTALGDVNFTSTSFTLNTIPRASTVSSSVSWTAGTSNLGVTLSVASSSFHHTLTLQVQDTGGTWYTVATRTSIGSSTTMTFTNSEITTMYQKNNMYENRPATLYVDTYDSSNNHIGSQQSKAGTMYAVATATTTFGTSNAFTIGSSLAYNINKSYISGASDLSTWSYDFVATLGNWTKTWANNYLQSGTLTLTSTDINSIYAQIPTSNSGTIAIRTRMYYNRVLTEDGAPASDTTNVTANVDKTVSTPVFNASPTYLDGNSLITGVTHNNQYIVQNQSDLQVFLNCSQQGKAQNSATISSYVCTVNGIAVQQSNNAPTAIATLSVASNTSSTLTAATYYVVYSWTLSGKETFVSPETSITVAAQQNLVIKVPSFPTNVTAANIYVSTTSNAETKQNTISASAGTLTISAPIVSGAAMPTMMFDMGKVNSGTNNSITLAAVDSRGNQTSVTTTFNLVPYQPPVVSTTSTRTSGFDVVTTTTLSSSTYSVCNVNGTPVNTIVSAQYRFKKHTVSTYPTTGAGSPTAFSNLVVSSGTYHADSASPNDGINGGLDNTVAWDIEVIVVDSFGNTATYLANSSSFNIGNAFKDNTVAAGIPILFVDSSLKSVGVGKFPTGTGTFETAGDLDVSGEINSAPSMYWSQDGHYAISLGNSDIIGTNAIYFNDPTDVNNGEGLMFLKSSKTQGSRTLTDYDNITVKDGIAYLNANKVFNEGDIIIQTGFASVTSTANVVSSLPVTFSSAFPGTPSVVLTPNTGVPYTYFKGFSYNSLSSTGFTVNMYRTDTQTTSFSWVAVWGGSR